MKEAVVNRDLNLQLDSIYLINMIVLEIIVWNHKHVQLSCHFLLNVGLIYVKILE